MASKLAKISMSAAAALLAAKSNGWHTESNVAQLGEEKVVHAGG